MSFKIDSGLFKYDFIDHHAILCVPLDADAKDVRKRYLKIARRLHPDSRGSASLNDNQMATELLSKLVNPAYEKLSQEKYHAEYILVLSHMGKRLVQESTSVELCTDIAKQLATAPNIEHMYKTAITKIAETQYESLQQALQVIGLVSELNLVYLMRSAGKSLTPQPSISQPRDNPAADQLQTPQHKISEPPNEELLVEQYLRRAHELMEKNQLTQARVELQDALKLEPNNSRCHSLIGVVYLKQNQTTMAKVHFDRTLQLDPNDQVALAGRRKIEQLMGQKNGAQPTVTSDTKAKQSNKSGGGLFGGLFGGKKK
jgi:curved DNA-binding protein CbpA